MDAEPVNDSESRTWAMGAHLSAIVGAFLGGLPAFLGPLVVWLVRRDGDPFAADHGREALNFNITVLALGALGFILAFLTLGLGLILVIPIALVIGVLWLLWTIQATVAASRGEPYRYPLSVRLIR